MCLSWPCFVESACGGESRSTRTVLDVHMFNVIDESEASNMQANVNRRRANYDCKADEEVFCMNGIDLKFLATLMSSGVMQCESEVGEAVRIKYSEQMAHR